MSPLLPSWSDVGKLARAIRAGDRASLARAITLIESKRADHRRSATARCRTCCRDPARRSASGSPARRASANPPPSTRSARF